MLLLTFSANAETSAGNTAASQVFHGLTSGPFIAISIRVENGREDVRVLKKIRSEKTIMLICRE
jgi:hypothetical protein